MERKNKILTLTSIAAAILVFSLILTAPLDSQTIPTAFVAGEKMGFNLDPGELNFGKIIPGGSATRDITIKNTYKYPTLTKIKSSGEISKYIIVSENNILLQPNESKNITFSVFAEVGIELKEYPGEITIITKKA
jgi:hypothetical protein